MYIVITHLTRMRAGRIGVAGVDAETHRFVRPTLWGRPLGLQDVVPNGGPFDVGAVVELGEVRPTPTRPALEDCEYEPGAIVEHGLASGAEYWSLLRQLARPKLRGIFGGPLRHHGSRGAAVEEGAGIASLGILAPRGRPKLYVVDGRDGCKVLRLHLRDKELDLFATVTDLRLHQDDGATIDPAAVSEAIARMNAGEKLLLSVGLSRAFSRRLDDPPAHWLLVSNIHFESRPRWELADAWQRPAGVAASSSASASTG